MPAYVARRLFFSIFVLWAAVSVIFIVLRLAPGDPALSLLGPDATPAQLAALRGRMGLDQPLLVQYGIYMRDVLSLDFGSSLRFGVPAITLVMSRLPATIELGVTSLVVSLVIGFPLGIVAALRANGVTDRLVSFLSLVSHSTPAFWVGIVLILVFARRLQLLPSGGTGSWQHMVLPAFTLALPFLAILVRLVRSSLLEVLHEGYVQTARAKGLPEHTVLFRHATRNALIPVVTVIGLQFGTLLTGAVIVETVFAWPGVGRLLIDAIFSRDYGVVQAAILLVAATFVLINLFVDVLYGYLDPRIRITE